MEWLRGLFDWISSLFGSLRSIQKNVLLLGLDNAGKTTLLYLLKTGNLVQSVPTRTLNRESVVVEGVTLEAVDLGGQEMLRNVWDNWFMDDIGGVIFVIDSSDRSRFEEGQQCLEGLLNDEKLEDCPFVVIANKRDRRGSVSSDMIAEIMRVETTGKEHSSTQGVRPIEFFDVSLVDVGQFQLRPALAWFAYQATNYQPE